MKGNGTSLIIERSSWLVVLEGWNPKIFAMAWIASQLCTLVHCTISSPKCPLQISEQPCLQTNKHTAERMAWTNNQPHTRKNGMNKQTTAHKKEWHEQTNNRTQERMAWIGVNAAQGRQWLNYQRVTNIVSNEGWWQDKKCDLIMASLGRMWHIPIQMSFS
jgi:L-lactate utilization protein LutB